MQTASEEQRHFSEQLRGLSGKGKGGVGCGGGGRGKGKAGNALLDSQYAEFYRDALRAIACERASYHQTCSSLKQYLSHSAKRSGGEGEGGGEAAADSVPVRRGWGAMEEREGEAAGRPPAPLGSDVGGKTEGDCVKRAREGLAALVEEALHQGNSYGPVHATESGAVEKRLHGAKGLQDTGHTGHTGVMAMSIANTHTHTHTHMSTRSLVVHPAVPPRKCRAPAGMDRAVVVSGDASSPSAACVEYLCGVKRLIDRSTPVLQSGAEMGTMELVATQDMGLFYAENMWQVTDAHSQRGADLLGLDALVRVVLAGLGLQHACGPIAAGIEEEVTYSKELSLGIGEAVAYCKGACLAVGLVFESKVANAVVLLPHAQRCMAPAGTPRCSFPPIC